MEKPDGDRDLFVRFSAALGIAPPWRVTSVAFDKGVGRLEIRLDFPRGSRFACPEPECPNAACPVRDTIEETWRHLDFVEHQALLVARVPTVDCAQHGVHLVAVPWARPDSGFTVLMEVAMLTFANQMPIAPPAQMAREHDTSVTWRPALVRSTRVTGCRSFTTATTPQVGQPTRACSSSMCTSATTASSSIPSTRAPSRLTKYRVVAVGSVITRALVLLA